MSWWDATGLTSFATQALKTAQKRIDKVLDIKEEEEALNQGNLFTLFALYSTQLLTELKLKFVFNRCVKLFLSYLL